MVLVDQDCRASFEGDLSKVHLGNIEWAKSDETLQVHRHTIWPKQDFLVVPVTQESLPQIINVIDSETAFSSDCIDHFQIELEEQIVFGSYDNLDQSCFIAYPPMLREDLDKMVESGLIASYIEEQYDAT